MTGSTEKKISLRKEAWKEIKATAHVWWLWGVGSAIVFSMFVFCNPPQTDFVDWVKQWPESIYNYSGEDYFLAIAPRFLFWLFVYIIQTTYMGHVLELPSLRINAKNFLLWFKSVIGVILFCHLIKKAAILWGAYSHELMMKIGEAPFFILFFLCLICVFYALARCQLVFPAAVLRCGAALKTSVSITRNNVWRIFIDLIVMEIQILIVYYAAICGVVLLLEHQDNFYLHFLALVYLKGLCVPDAWLFNALAAFSKGLFVSINLVAWSIFTCVTYRVLLQEGRG